MEKLLPRHLQIIYDINSAFLAEVKKKFPGDDERLRRMSIIEEGGEKRVQMANLAVIGSTRVNGVSALHSHLLREHLFHDFYEMDSAKFLNETNGVTPRRWLLKCNPGLSKLITCRIGEGWETDLDQLTRLTPFATDPEFQAEWQTIKRQNKERLAEVLKRRFQIELDPTHLIDSQVKRIHEYKRQLLNILNVVSLYLTYRSKPPFDVTPRTFLFAGKAAPGYDMAKRIIHLINSVAQVVNSDVNVRQYLRVVFVPNYSVSLAEVIVPATDVSEQISTAGTEASGTGNMKFAMNGALTVGTLDGANLEIKDAVGEANMFLFGLTTEQVAAAKAKGYNPQQLYYGDPLLRSALDAVSSGVFSPDDPNRFKPVVDSLLYGGDTYMVLADFLSYVHCQRSVEAAYHDQSGWTRRAIHNRGEHGAVLRVTTAPFSATRATSGVSTCRLQARLARSLVPPAREPGPPLSSVWRSGCPPSLTTTQRNRACSPFRLRRPGPPGKRRAPPAAGGRRRGEPPALAPKRIYPQNAASNTNVAHVTPTWYAETRRSKKFASSWTSCRAMNENGFFVP